MNKVKVEYFKTVPKKRVFYSELVFSVVIVLLSGFLCHMAATHSGDFFTNPNIIAGFYLLPCLLIAGLYGYFISAIVFLIAFIASLYFNRDMSYAMIVQMSAMVCFSLCAQFDWLKTKLKTFFMCVLTFVTISFNEFLCFIALDNIDFTKKHFNNFIKYTHKEFIAIFGLGFILHFYFMYANDKYKSPFPISFLYTKAYKDDVKLNKKHKQTKLSIKMTTIIIGILLILGICVSFFMMVLYPDIKSAVINNPISSSFELDSSYNDLRNELVAQLKNSEFKIDKAMIAFDLKMIMLMLNVGVPIAAIATYYVKMTVCSYLGTMSDFMEKYAAASDEDKIRYGHNIDDIEVHTHDEIRTLYDAIHTTVYEVEAYIGRIKERKTLENDLEIAKKASEAKSDFLSNMSHEIRTPINAVLGMNEMILRESDNRQIIEYANNVKTAGNSLLSLVNDILDFSKIEAGKMDILRSQYNLASLVNDLVNIISPRVQEKGLELEVNVDKNMPANLIGDEIRLKQIVMNLLTNAVKYTDSGKIIIDVSYDKINEFNIVLHFSISDTGIGIKEEELHKLYSPFERIDEIRNRTIEGTGLGMSIVRKLLALMDTKLEVKSVYGQGSVFSFGVKQQVFSWDAIGDFKEMYNEYVESAEKYQEYFQAPDAHILVVDDTEMNLTVIKSLLKQTKLQITTATSGFETLNLVKKERFDMIFLDHRMPEMDGIETFEAMKVMADNKNLDVPVIALTANAVAGAREEYMEHGFTDYISKPINSEHLERLLLHYLPDEKIQTVSVKIGEDSYKSEFAKVIPADSVLNELKEVDLQAGVNNCGDVVTYEKVVHDFYISIDSKAEAMEVFAEEEDIRNYTILVHALKSSARLVGALELSKLAEELEDLGNMGNMKAILGKNGLLLDMYRGYKEHLKAIDESDDDKPEISVEEVERAFKDIKELVEAYDFDTADSIMEMLGTYKIPEEIKEKYLDVQQLIVAVDRDTLLEFL